jgi:hypothetical protein
MTRALSYIVPSYPNIRSAAAAAAHNIRYIAKHSAPLVLMCTAQISILKNARDSKYFEKAIAILNAKSIFLFHLTFVWV